MMRTDRIQIAYTLTFSAPFHCGTGVRRGLIDRSVMRDGGEYLYIPGSTLKGVVRELCEQLARFYEDNDETMRERIVTPHDKALALRDLGKTHSLVTRIFGSQILPGSLYFADARQTKSDMQRYDAPGEDGAKRYQHMQTDDATQVRLHRPTRTAVQGALYTSEFGRRTMAFEGSITGGLECLPISAELDEAFADKDNGPTYSLLLLLAGLRMLERLGGNKSTGKGECCCTIRSLSINDQPIAALDNQQPGENWLQHLDILSYYSLLLQEEA